MEQPKFKPSSLQSEKQKNYEFYVAPDVDFYGLRDIAWSIVVRKEEELGQGELMLDEKKVFMEFIQPIINQYSSLSGINPNVFSAVYITKDYEWYFGDRSDPETRATNLLRMGDFFTHLTRQVTRHHANLN